MYLIATIKMDIRLRIIQKIGSVQMNHIIIKPKIMVLISSLLSYSIDGKIEVDKTSNGAKQKGTRRRFKASKRLETIDILHLVKGISRAYAASYQRCWH